MPLPETAAAPPFAITRLSHVILNVRDLAASRAFYEELIGLVASDADEHRVYLRGVEEAAHHSLVLVAGDAPSAERIGFRVASEEDLDAAQHSLEGQGLPHEWAEIPHQGRTLRFSDVAGVPIELCASMPVQRRLMLEDAEHRGAAAARIDHLQLHIPEVAAWTAFHVANGFRISEYATPDGTPESPLLGVFLARKGDLLDLVGVTGPGPRLHHVAFVVHEHSATAQRVCDQAASRGWREAIEFGPGRHGLAPQHFLYLRDPDGHRVELVSHGYLLLDPEVEPLGWSIADPRAITTWGPAPCAEWFTEASEFAGVTPGPPIIPGPDGEPVMAGEAG